MSPRDQAAIHRLGIPGVYFQREERRLYTHGNLAAHAVGFTDVDGKGLMGIERQFDGSLRGAVEPLQLSLDIRLQHILRKELQASVAEFQAIGAGGMILDVRSGEVLAMVSLPDFNPHNPTGLDENTRFNRNTLGVYEMGSTFKIFNSALAFESGKIRLGDVFETSPIRIGRHTISDYHPENRPLNVAEIFMHSSNLGSVRMLQKVGTTAQREFMGKLGLLDMSPVEIPEKGKPLVPKPWREINGMTISFGHGLSVSPMQLASAAATTINGGLLYPPTLLKHAADAPADGQRVLTEQTSALMRRMFRLVVEKGTAKGAAAPGYAVGGKTGTAEKLTGRTYNRKARMSSFVGAFPMNDPRYLVLAIIDEPKGNKRTYGYATGSWVAAPVVGAVVRQMGPLYGIKPINEEDPALVQAIGMPVSTR
jgi:cell division protein FtsI (penicillin-binding protein 3)